MAIRAETPDNTAINGEVQRIIEQLWNSKKAMTFDSGLLVEQSRLLLGAMNNGYGKTLTDVAWNSPDFEMLANLTKNVYQFSAAKNYQELKDFTTAIADGDRIRSFAEYQTACNDINAKYNGSWLLTEYNQAIASSQMAGKWADFEANKKDMPMLKYQTIGDGNVRDSHARLDGIVKHIDDPFWNSYYPPNGWNCFKKDTLILTANGWTAIQTIKRGDIIVGGSGNYQLVEGFHVNTFNGNTCTIFSKRETVTCTPNHRFMTHKGWQRAECIERGDIIVQVGKVGFFNKVVNAIHNVYSLLFYCFMTFVRKGETTATHTFNSKIKRWNINIKPMVRNIIIKLKV